jgi:hypothetical protein
MVVDSVLIASVEDEGLSSSPVEASVPGSPVWKRDISARVQAHRSRRQAARSSVHEEESHSSPVSLRMAGVAASVAERYAAAPSYSHYLAKLTDEEHSPIEVAEREEYEPAKPALFSSDSTDFATQGSSALDLAMEPMEPIESEPAPQPAPQPAWARAVFPPELETELAAPSATRNRLPERQHGVPRGEKFLEQALVEPDVPIAPKLIEFPRQLVASRRARPRLAEGPLREESAQQNTDAQLRIFEVEPEQISRVPLAAQTLPANNATAPAAEWHYIRLDTPLLSSPALAHAVAYDETVLEVAPLRRRGLAAALDIGLVTLGFLIFAVGFIAVASHPPSDWLALAAAAGVFAALLAGYQWLFFTLSDATPGMRYARIALCTFQDENPNQRQRRARVLASFLAAASAGLGYAWIWFDNERLGWPDRISRTYQRCY